MTAQTDTRTVTITPLTGPADALYHHYPGQSGPQDCYIALDIRDGHMWADYNAEIGNAVPSDVWHGIVRRWSIPALQPATVNAIMEKIAPLAQTILNNSEIIWDGSNHVARLDRAAVIAEEEIAGDGTPFEVFAGYGTPSEWHDGVSGILDREYLESDVHVWDASEWLEPVRELVEQRIAAGETLDALYDEYQGDGARDDAPFLDGLMPYLEGIAADVRAEAQDGN